MCPNIGECWEEREATFLILGTKCTRRCGFCDVMTAKPEAVDPEEPTRIAETVARMGLRYVVLTGVARDDLPDGGASVWAEAIGACRAAVPGIDVEVLPSDFKGGERDIATVLAAEPTVFAHNLETVPRLHERIRPAFGYERSLDVLRFAKRSRAGQVTKSNLILGMGETAEEVHRRPWRPARHRGRHRDDGTVSAAHAAASPGAPMGARPRSSPSTRRRARRWGSRTSRPARSFARATTRESSCGARWPPASAPEERRSRPVSRILCAGSPAGDHLSRPRSRATATRSPGRCGLPGSSGGPPSNAPCSTLLRTGVTEPRRSPAALVGSYPTVAPLPPASPRTAVSFLLPLREVAPAWLAPASCPAESGLSSNDHR